LLKSPFAAMGLALAVLILAPITAAAHESVLYRFKGGTDGFDPDGV
jgi:hypothetical protein